MSLPVPPILPASPRQKPDEAHTRRALSPRQRPRPARRREGRSPPQTSLLRAGLVPNLIPFSHAGNHDGCRKGGGVHRRRAAIGVTRMRMWRFTTGRAGPHEYPSACAGRRHGRAAGSFIGEARSAWRDAAIPHPQGDSDSPSICDQEVAALPARPASRSLKRPSAVLLIGRIDDISLTSAPGAAIRPPRSPPSPG